MGVRGTEFFTSYNNGEIDVRVITGAVHVNASVSGGSSTPPAPPAPGGLQPGDAGQLPPQPTRPVRPPAPPPPPPPAPGAPEAPGRMVSFTVEAMQQARFSEHSTPEELLAPPQPLSLDGLDVVFIDRIQKIAQELPEIIPEEIRNTIPEVRQQAEERRQERAYNPNVAPDEFTEPPSAATNTARQIIQSTPATNAPPVIPVAPVIPVMPAIPTTPSPPSPPVTYTVTFNSQGGSINNIASGNLVTLPTPPTRVGYTFTGWSTVFDNVSSHLTVTAQYTIVEPEPDTKMVSSTASWVENHLEVNVTYMMDLMADISTVDLYQFYFTDSYDGFYISPNSIEKIDSNSIKLVFDNYAYSGSNNSSIGNLLNTSQTQRFIWDSRRVL